MADARAHKVPPLLCEEYYHSPELLFSVPCTPSPSMAAPAMMACNRLMTPPPPMSAPLLPERLLEKPPPPPPALPPRLWTETAAAVQLALGSAWPAPLHSPRVSDPESDGEAAAELAFKVKNTFLDGRMDLKRILQEGRQVRSCPGSRLASPRGEGDKGQAAPERGELEVVSSQASTADTVETDRLQHEPPADLEGAPGLLEGAARRGIAFPPPRKAQILLLSRVLDDTASPGLHCPLPVGVLSSDCASYRGRGGGRLTLGSPGLPSIGSFGHEALRCKPCAFILRFGCASGEQCSFCHLCGDGEKKRRRKEKRALKAMARIKTPATAEA